MSARWTDKEESVFEPAGRRGRWLPLWRPANVSRFVRQTLSSFKPQGDIGFHAARRLENAERRGLQFAILCRTLVFGFAFVWYVLAFSLSGFVPPLLGFFVLAFMTGLGIAHFMIIGTRYDSEPMRYVTLGADVVLISLMFAFAPVYSSADAPQIYAFRSFGVHLYLPFVALATLTLSARLTLWVGILASFGFLAAFTYVVWQMDNAISWTSIPANATLDEYNAVFLSPDFIGRGSRIGEFLSLVACTVILAVAVTRARFILFAQIRAEEAREAERDKRNAISRQLGRFVPSAIASRLIANPSGLAPQVRHGVVLVLDVVNFSGYAEGRDPSVVIADLNGLLAACADQVSEVEGVVIQFTGDGLLATLNTPIEVDDPETLAVALAGRLVRCAAEKGLKVRVGVAAGPVASGAVGSDERQAFTVYGETVNRAARLESFAKTLGETVLTDAAVAERAVNVTLEPKGAHSLRGLKVPVDVFALSTATK